MINDNESYVERIKRETKGFNKLDPEFVKKEKREQLGYLVRMRERLGREISESEMDALSNIL